MHSVCEVDLRDEEEIEGMVEPAAVGGDRAVTRSRAGKTCDAGLDSIGFVYGGSLDCDEEEEHNRRLDDITNVLGWEAKALGYTYLGSDELV